MLKIIISRQRNDCFYHQNQNGNIDGIKIFKSSFYYDGTNRGGDNEKELPDMDIHGILKMDNKDLRRFFFWLFG